MKFEAVIESSGRRIEVEFLEEGRFRVAGIERQVDIGVIAPGVYSLIVDGQSHEVVVRDDKKRFLVESGAHLIPVKLVDPSKASQVKDAVEGEAVITSPMPGRVIGIKVEVGSSVKEGEGVAVVEAMKMENELHAPKAGKVTKVLVKVGDTVESGQDLLVIE